MKLKRDVEYGQVDSNPTTQKNKDLYSSKTVQKQLNMLKNRKMSLCITHN